MVNERIIPSRAQKSVATFTILSGGNKVSKTYHVLSVTVNKEVNRIASATIIMLDGEASKQSFQISNTADFEPGKEIEIRAGYRADEQTIFKGIVVKHGIKIRKNNSVLVVECKDETFKMTVACKSKYFRNKKDSDIIEEIIDSYKIAKTVEVTSAKHKQVVQYNSTDWDFILCRCDVMGLLCFVNDNKITISKPQFNGTTALTIQYGATIRDLDAEIDARFQFKSVKGSSWNYTKQQLLDTIEAEDPKLPPAGNLSSKKLAVVNGENEFRLYHSGNIEAPELQAWVNAKMMKHQLAKIRGRVRTDGTAAVNPGQLMQLNGVGERFQGKLYVTGVRQEVGNGTWQTVFQFGVNPEWFAETYKVQQPQAGAMLPGIEGLQVGVVTQLQNDPDGEDRILVRIPVIHKAQEGAWCRVCALDAGNNRGTFFRPEIQDEVIVGFINNDPRHGVVLGMVNSSAKPAPLKASDSNPEKGYVSREKIKMIFNDEDKSLKIETPGGRKITVSDTDNQVQVEDPIGNKIKMGPTGVEVQSLTSVKLTAVTDITLQAVNILLAAANISMGGGGGGASFSLGGGDSSMKASKIKIESTDLTEIKSGLVKIN